MALNGCQVGHLPPSFKPRVVYSLKTKIYRHKPFLIGFKFHSVTLMHNLRS
jgi:hypothetical protein